MPELMLIYFNARGRAELARWILAYSGIPYTDERIDKKDWATRKADVYTNQVPLLIIDGRPLSQSLAIARYLARMADLQPCDSYDSARCDALVDRLSDVASKVNQIVSSEKCEEDKTAALDKLADEEIKPFLARVSIRIKGKWYISDKVTWADLALGLYLSDLQKDLPEILKDLKNLEELVDRVLDLPQIKEWNDSQPELPSPEGHVCVIQ